jgi:hypothetical protein
VSSAVEKRDHVALIEWFVTAARLSRREMNPPPSRFLSIWQKRRSAIRNRRPTLVQKIFGN